MKLKPLSGSDVPDTRIDGVAYTAQELYSYGKIWSYPTSRPSIWFTSSNDQIIAADRKFEGMTDAEKEPWFEWFFDLTPMELCMIWDSLVSGRDLHDQVKAAYVNCKLWAGYFGGTLDDPPPTYQINDLYDILACTNDAVPWLEWFRDEADPDPLPYFAVWLSWSMRAPTSPPPIRKMRFCGIVQQSWNQPINLHDWLYKFCGPWPSKNVNVAVALGAVGSAPAVGRTTSFYKSGG